ncbi:polypeptide N-acetylgalactosaminyltransferase 17-like isoform X1 [Acipenser ruthenus]|uniref:polypeptide N-acetylgalactosaminyltransferase 17-like isoform X1 n=2 Tax=Acipenser ruthenus TaxID=7906 RepID=UPI002740D32E|nr:polypeptide N-acetylgalactosaminyltransferase 17-like isoform X1 [Acipenser ruthenus]
MRLIYSQYYIGYTIIYHTFNLSHTHTHTHVGECSRPLYPRSFSPSALRFKASNHNFIMAVLLRRWRGLLVLNLMVVTGFMIFWTKYKSRTMVYTEQGLPVQTRKDSNLTSQGSRDSQETVLKRLSFLEEVVYRQLNGLSKSLGLIEGYEGRGKGGLAATLSPDEQVKAKELGEKYGYNAYLSQKISLDRSLPDFRPSKCKELTYRKDLPQVSLIFIFVNEALSVILRSVHSAVNHTPAHLLKEIILVDDNSDDDQLKGPLEEYVNKRYPGLVKIVRNKKREGLIRARIEGWKAATGEVTGFFDAHVEFTPSWAEPVLSRIKENRKRIILPSIDNIKQDTFELVRYKDSGHGYNWELWCMYISPPKEWWDAGDVSAPIRTPAMIGCSFVVNRKFFGEIGLLDPGMEVYGAENIELGIKVWLCGGSMEVLPCSRVAHIERRKKPYHNNIGYFARRNSLRVAEVWMDDYKSHVYMAWNIPMEDHGIDIGDISQRVALRKSMNCKSFQWYLDNVYPEMRTYNTTLFYGELRNNKVSNLCIDQGEKENHTAILYPCHGWAPQLARYTKEGFLYLGSLGSTKLTEDTRCIVDDKNSRFPQLLNCEKITNVRQKSWHFFQSDSIVNVDTGRCLEVIPTKGGFGFELLLQSCTGQKWNIKHSIKQGQ